MPRNPTRVIADDDDEEEGIALRLCECVLVGVILCVLSMEEFEEAEREFTTYQTSTSFRNQFST